MKYKKIFVKSLALALRRCGHKIIKVEPNYKKPELDVWTFEVSGNFMADFERLSQQLRDSRQNWRQ